MLATRPGAGVRGWQRLGPGKAEDSNWKEHTGAQRTGAERDGGGERHIFFITSKMDLFRKSNVPKLQFRICRLWRITYRSGEKRRSLLSYGRTGSWGTSPDAINRVQQRKLGAQRARLFIG